MTYQGIPVVGGKAEGLACVLTSVKDLVKVQQGDIVVVDRATPLYAPAFKKAKGLIVAEGGRLTHASVLAREYALPCIILKHATTLLHDGDRVEIHADIGTVCII